MDSTMTPQRVVILSQRQLLSGGTTTEVAATTIKTMLTTITSVSFLVIQTHNGRVLAESRRRLPPAITIMISIDQPAREDRLTIKKATSTIDHNHRQTTSASSQIH